MATDFTALAEQVSIEMQKRIVDHSDDVLKVSTPVIETKDSIKVVDMDGGNNFTAVSGVASPSGSFVRALKSVSAPERFEVNIPLAADDILDMGGLAKAAARIATLLIARAFAKLSVDFWTFVFGARAIAHPLNGAGHGLAANGGGTVYIVDAFTTTPINGAAAFNSTNDHTLSLTATNLRTVLNKRGAYRDLDGGGSAPKGKPWLCVVPELAGVAKNFQMQSGQLNNGAGLQEGFADELAGVIVIPREATTSADGWCLMYVSENVDESGNVTGQEGPVLVHLRALPNVKITEQPGGGATNVYCDFAYDVFAHPAVQRDLQYSEP